MTTILTIGADCLLSDISIIFEKELKAELTIDNPQYIAAKRYGRWIGKKLKPHLTYYEQEVGGVRFPRGFANQAVRMCRHHNGSDPQIVDNRHKLDEIDLSFAGTLRPYQEEAVSLALPRSMGVIEAGTGSGKTVMALALIARRRQPTLVVVHTKELLYQWAERIKDFLGIEAGIIGDGKFDLAPVSVAIVNTARKRVAELVPHFGQLIVDECHRVPATLFTDVVSRFDCYYLLGFSATAFRSDDEMTKLIYYFLGERIHRVDHDQLKATGAILAPQLIRTPTSFTYRYTGDYQALIKALVKHEGRNLQILGDIEKVVREKDPGIVLVVSDRLSHCQFFADKLGARGIQVRLLSGQVAPDERNIIVEEVRENRIAVLVATLQLIGEGFDCPGLSTLFLTTPISFEGRLLQVIGRIMRPAAQKRARVFDYVDENVPALMRSARTRVQILSSL